MQPQLVASCSTVSSNKSQMQLLSVVMTTAAKYFLAKNTAAAAKGTSPKAVLLIGTFGTEEMLSLARSDFDSQLHPSHQVQAGSLGPPPDFLEAPFLLWFLELNVSLKLRHTSLGLLSSTKFVGFWSSSTEHLFLGHLMLCWVVLGGCQVQCCLQKLNTWWCNAQRSGIRGWHKKQLG